MPKSKPAAMSNEKKKLYALGGLLGVLVLVSVWSFWPEDKAAPPPPPSNQNDGRVKNSDLATQGGAANAPAPAKPRNPNEPEYGPVVELPISLITSSGGAYGVTRNIFAYPPPPVVVQRQPPFVTAKPPTINLGSISPNTAVAGTSRPVTITASGSAFPRDAQIIWNGRALQTERLSENLLRATVGPGDIATAGQATVLVKSASQPDRLWSGPASFNIQRSPEPSEAFVFTGRIGNQAVITFKDGQKRSKLVNVGDTLNASVPWKVLNINDRSIEMLDTRNEIRKSLTLTNKSTS